MIIGLTGGIGSGKTTVSNMFSALGIDIVDADVVARKVVEPGTTALKQIEARFGQHILQVDGELDRSQLRTLVFNNYAHKAWLNQLLHPLIREEMLAQLTSSKTPYCILVAPLLLENKLEQFVDRILVIDTKETEQIERTLKRDESDEKEIKSIIASQMSRENKIKAADDIIDNSTVSIAQLSAQVSRLHQKYLKLTKAF